MKRIEQIVVIFIAAALSIPSYWFFWTLAGGGGYNRDGPARDQYKKRRSSCASYGRQSRDTKKKW